MFGKDECPDDILVYIFEYLPEYRELLMCVCRKWRDVISNNIFIKAKSPWNPYFMIDDFVSRDNKIVLRLFDEHEIKYNIGLRYRKFGVLVYTKRPIMLLKKCIMYGCNKAMEWLYGLTNVVDETFKIAMKEAAKHGNIYALNYLYEKYTCTGNQVSTELMKYITEQAVINGKVYVLEWLNDIGVLRQFDHWKLAAMHCQSEIILWAVCLGDDIPSVTMDTAIEFGHVGLAMELSGMGVKPSPGCCMENAVASNNVMMVKWVCETYGGLFTESMCLTATEADNVEMLRYLRELRCPWNRVQVYKSAIAVGSLSIVKFLHESGMMFSEDMLNESADDRTFDIFMYIVGTGNCVWTITTMRIAASNNAVKVFQYAYENGCPTDERVLVSAVRSLSVSVMKYAWGAKHPWNTDLYYEYSGDGFAEIIRSIVSVEDG